MLYRRSDSDAALFFCWVASVIVSVVYKTYWDVVHGACRSTWMGSYATVLPHPAEWGAVIAKLCQTERFLDRPSKDKG